MALLYIPTSEQDFPKLKGFGCGSDIIIKIVLDET